MAWHGMAWHRPAACTPTVSILRKSWTSSPPSPTCDTSIKTHQTHHHRPGNDTPSQHSTASHSPTRDRPQILPKPPSRPKAKQEQKKPTIITKSGPLTRPASPTKLVYAHRMKGPEPPPPIPFPRQGAHPKLWAVPSSPARKHPNAPTNQPPTANHPQTDDGLIGFAATATARQTKSPKALGWMNGWMDGWMGLDLLGCLLSWGGRRGRRKGEARHMPL